MYKADEGGFQPEAEHIPVAVEDTNEVAEAKANFYTLFKEHEAKVQEALENDEAVAEVVDEAVAYTPNSIAREVVQRTIDECSCISRAARRNHAKAINKSVLVS